VVKRICILKQKTAHNARSFKKFVNERERLQVANQIREDVTNGRAKQRQNNDNDDGDQNQNKRVFDQTLTFFAGHVQHLNFSLFDNDIKTVA